MEQTERLANQQERPSAIEMAWLGGLFDGEGHVGLSVQQRWDTVILHPQITIVNTNPIIIERVQSIAQRAGLPLHLHWKSVTSGRHKPLGQLYVAGAKRACRWIEALLPYVHGKKQECEILLLFIQSRFKRLHEPYGKKGAPSYDDFELDCYVRLKSFKSGRHTESSETIRRTLLKRLQRRYSPSSERKPERAAEMTAPAA